MRVDVWMDATSIRRSATRPRSGQQGEHAKSEDTHRATRKGLDGYLRIRAGRK